MNGGVIVRSKGKKIKVTENENAKIVSRAYLRQKWIDLRPNQHDHHRPILHMLSNSLYFTSEIVSTKG